MVSHRIEYSDGRQEVVDLPSAYQAGDVLAITHMNNGGVIAQRVSPAVAWTHTGTLMHENTGDFDAEVFRQFFTYIKTESGAPYKLRFTLLFNDSSTVVQETSEVYSTWTKYTVDFPDKYGLKTLKIECMSNYGYVYLDDMGINYNNDYDYEYVDWDFEYPGMSLFTYSGRSERSTDAKQNGTYGWKFYAP